MHQKLIKNVLFFSLFYKNIFLKDLTNFLKYILSGMKLEDLNDENSFILLQEGIQIRLHQYFQFPYINESGKVFHFLSL